ncbi:MAG: phage holin family protein [Chlamydiales bacterium]
MSFFINLLLNALAILFTGFILPGVHIEGFLTALFVSLILGFVNTFLRPIIFILTLPINILTLGLFSFVIMGLMVFLVAKIVPGFALSSFLWAIPFALVASFFNWVFSSVMLRRIHY